MEIRVKIFHVQYISSEFYFTSFITFCSNQSLVAHRIFNINLQKSGDSFALLNYDLNI